MMEMVNRRYHRMALRKAGLRPITIRVPNTRSVGFAEECRRQSLSLRNDANERETLDQLVALADTKGW